MYCPDAISEEELKEHGFEKCKSYCTDYCWPHGYGYCNNCAYDKELKKRINEDDTVFEVSE